MRKTGQRFVKKDYNVILVDFDPEVVTKWQEEGLNAEYGDAEAPELPVLLLIKNTKNIISTVPDLGTNIRLLQCMNENDYEGKITEVAHTDDDEK